MILDEEEDDDDDIPILNIKMKKIKSLKRKLKKKDEEIKELSMQAECFFTKSEDLEDEVKEANRRVKKMKRMNDTMQDLVHSKTLACMEAKKRIQGHEAKIAWLEEKLNTAIEQRDDAKRKASVATWQLGQHSCSICMEPSVGLHPDSVKTSCNHVFHKRCITSWLFSDRSASSNCPNCRSDISRDIIAIYD
jgi:myosin heavy subunit